MATYCGHFQILWIFYIFSKFIKFHQTCRIYWDQHLKPACDIRAHSDWLKVCMKNRRQCQPLQILWNVHTFFEFIKVRKGAKIDTIKYHTWPHGKCQKHNFTLQTRAQQVTTRQQWTEKKAWQTHDTYKTKDPQKKYRLGLVIKNILLEI